MEYRPLAWEEIASKGTELLTKQTAGVPCGTVYFSD